MNELPKRKSIRLKNYDYSQNGYYFITICTNNRKPLFWKYENISGADFGQDEIGKTPVGADDPVCPHKINLSPIGEIVEQCWNNINEIYDNVKTDFYMIMPDHFHGIIVINDNMGENNPTLSKIVQGLKSVTTRLCFKYGQKHIWQRNYYEHIIRNETEYIETVEYMMNNPLKKIIGNTP